MKLILFLGVLLSGVAFAAGEGYVNFVRQIQQNTGVSWDMPVASQGAAASPLALELGGSLFQLWTIESITAKDYLLDQKQVGVYLPSAVVNVITEDPYTRIPRTRADRPFTVKVKLDGLLSGTGILDAASRVLLQRHVAAYPTGIFSLNPTQILAATPLSSSSLTKNGETVLNFPASAIPGSDPTKVKGEEYFVVHALADGNILQTQIAQGMVQIWPVSSGQISGIGDNDKVRYNMPRLTLSLTDLYPRSDTWVQIYKGSPSLGTVGETLRGSSLILDQDRSDSRILTVNDYDDQLKEDGVYTMELLTRTPFGVERLDYVTFEVDRKMEIRGQLSTIE